MVMYACMTHYIKIMVRIRRWVKSAHAPFESGILKQLIRR